MFSQLAEIRAGRYKEEVDELVLQTWRMKMSKNPHWSMTRDYIEDWRRGVLLATTSKYHNLVLRWNIRTPPQGARDQPREMESATYCLMDNKTTDLFVILLPSERSSKI